MTAAVLRADANHLPLSSGSVDLVVTSPPYFALRSYQDGGEHYAGQIGDEATPAEFVDALIGVTAECVRVLKPSGSIWVNLGDKYASYEGSRGDGRLQSNEPRGTRPRGSGLTGGGFVRNKSLMGLPWRYALRCIDDLGLILRAELIWSKPNGLPESVTDRVRRSHEQWFHFTKEPRYFAAVDEIREPHTWGRDVDPKWAAAREATAESRGGGHRNGVSGGFTNPPNPLGKLPGSVWTVATQPLVAPDHLGVEHFAAFPTAWPRRIVQGWCPEGGVVLDPFGGTGTTAMVAHALGRTGISVDLSTDYCRLARWRTTDLAQLAKVRGEAFRRPEPQLDGQQDLFADAMERL